MKAPLRVLCINYSIGFRGATKTTRLLYGHMPDPNSYVLTTQPKVLTQKWFSGSEAMRFRRLVNYRTRERFLSFVSRRISLCKLSRVAAKGFALVETTWKNEGPRPWRLGTRGEPAADQPAGYMQDIVQGYPDSTHYYRTAAITT